MVRVVFVSVRLLDDSGEHSMASCLTLVLPEFVVDVERRWEGLPDDVPLVVGGSAEGPGHVVAACRLTRQAGVRVGQPLGSAARLAPGARFVPGILDRYAETASMLDELVRRWCPEVEWVAIDRAVIPASALRAGSVAAVCEAMQRALRDELGLTSAAGIADTVVAAGVAADLVAPSGLLQVLPGYDARFIAPLDPGLLPGLTASARMRLAARGLTSIGAVAALAPADAEAALGEGWLRIWLASRAEQPNAQGCTRLPRTLTRALPLTTPVTSSDVQRAAEQLADQLADRLNQLGAFARAITVRVMGADQRFRGRGLTLREGARQRADLGPAARTLAAQLWRFGDAPVRVSVVVSGLIADGQQLSLFELSRADPRRTTAEAGAFQTLRGLRALARDAAARRVRAS